MKIVMNWLKEHILGVVIVVVLLATINVVQLIVYQNNIEGHEVELDALTKEKERLATENRLLNAEKERLVNDVTSLIIEKKQETEQLKLEIETLESKVVSAIIPFDFVMVQLKNNGFETPEELLDTLSNENDLIPYDGVLGGTMKWWPTESRIINNEWVLGYFEDGHILGHALLEYQIDDQQNVTWKLIKAILY
ncbi:MAG: hypothetical protein IBX70_07580 [Clostridia bacterium]|nr:hypothetical protein [Clostridia bacterium]